MNFQPTKPRKTQIKQIVALKTAEKHACRSAIDIYISKKNLLQPLKRA
jgi:hypothetical protein